MEDKVAVSMTLSKDLLARVDAVAPKRKRTAFILKAVEEFIDRHERRELEGYMDQGGLQGLA